METGTLPKKPTFRPELGTHFRNETKRNENLTQFNVNTAVDSSLLNSLNDNDDNKGIKYNISGSTGDVITLLNLGLSTAICFSLPLNLDG